MKRTESQNTDMTIQQLANESIDVVVRRATNLLATRISEQKRKKC
ncbi:MAG: hypothetical protein ACJ71C_03180 [Nitrososphaeraceae archaeon]